MMKSKTKTKVKLAALAPLLVATCWGTSCTTDLRDAFWAGALDYVTGTTTDTFTGVFAAEDIFPAD